MLQAQNSDFNNNNNNNSIGVPLAPPTGQYSSNTSLPGHISMLNTSASNQSLMAAAIHLNQSNQAYITAPGLAAIGYIYPNGNSYVPSQNLIYNPHNMIHGPMEMIPNVAPTMGHLSNSSVQHSHNMSGFDPVQHFGSLSSTQNRKPKNSIMSKTNLYINGLQESATDESVRALVDGIIEPKSCKAMMSHGKCRGSGFIDCATEVDAEKVIQILRNKQMADGSRLAVKFAYENEKDDLNVYVRNLPRRSTFTNSDLEELFKEYGHVVSVKLLQSDNQYTGTGFVRFSSAEEAQRAVDHMNSQKRVLGNDDKPVICKLADKGGRRMIHGSGQPLSDILQHQSNGDIHHSNGVISAHSAPIDAVDKVNHGFGGLQVMASQPYATQHGAPWLPTGHASPDLLAQELQSLNLASGYAALVPGLVQAPMGVSTYTDDNVTQQQVLAHILWNQQPNNRMMAAATFSQPQTCQTLHHQQQQPQQSILHWPHPQPPTNGGIYYTPNNDQISSAAAYSQMIYHQYANRSPRSVMSAPNMKSPLSFMDQAAVINGQTASILSANTCIVNGNGNMDSHPTNKM